MDTSVISPLLERRDYVPSGMDQLEKNFQAQSSMSEDLDSQFRSRMRRRQAMDILSQATESLSQAIDKVADEVAGVDKVAVSPPGWSGTVKAMKSHKDITNPWALAWWMSKKDKGDKWGKGGKLSKKPKPHYKPEKKRKKKSSSEEHVAAVLDEIFVDDLMGDAQQFPIVTDSNKGYSTSDRLETSDGSYVSVRTNYKEENGEVLLEEYIVEKDGKVDKYDDVVSFNNRLAQEGLL
jgi:hypothetical protein